MAKTLDKTRPHATVHGDDESGARFEQDGVMYDAHGKAVGGTAVAAAKEGEAPRNIEGGNIPKFFLPLEEGGAGGGETASWPQTTTEGKKIEDEHGTDSAEDKAQAKVHADAEKGKFTETSHGATADRKNPVGRPPNK